MACSVLGSFGLLHWLCYLNPYGHCIHVSVAYHYFISQMVSFVFLFGLPTWVQSFRPNLVILVFICPSIFKFLLLFISLPSVFIILVIYFQWYPWNIACFPWQQDQLLMGVSIVTISIILYNIIYFTTCCP